MKNSRLNLPLPDLGTPYDPRSPSFNPSTHIDLIHELGNSLSPGPLPKPGYSDPVLGYFVDSGLTSTYPGTVYNSSQATFLNDALYLLFNDGSGTALAFKSFTTNTNPSIATSLAPITLTSAPQFWCIASTDTQIVAGGYDNTDQTTFLIKVFTPSTNTWSDLTSITSADFSPKAALSDATGAFFVGQSGANVAVVVVDVPSSSADLVTSTVSFDVRGAFYSEDRSQIIILDDNRLLTYDIATATFGGVKTIYTPVLGRITPWGPDRAIALSGGYLCRAAIYDERGDFTNWWHHRFRGGLFPDLIHGSSKVGDYRVALFAHDTSQRLYFAYAQSGGTGLGVVDALSLYTYDHIYLDRCRLGAVMAETAATGAILDGAGLFDVATNSVAGPYQGVVLLPGGTSLIHTSILGSPVDFSLLPC